MSAEIDPAKLKVVELRAELSSRGLDTKGNKAVLVKRLKDALEKELEKEIPDTSIADTSTEDLNTSQTEEAATTKDEKENKQERIPPADIEQNAVQAPEKLEDGKSEGCEKQINITKTIEPPKKNVKPEIEEVVEPIVKKAKLEKNVSDGLMQKDKESEHMEEEVQPKVEETVQEENKTEKQQMCEKQVLCDSEQTQQEGGAKKIDSSESADNSTENVKEELDTVSVEPSESNSTEKIDDSVVDDTQPKGDKRKRSPSPSKSQRRRSKSPIKEDEPVIDNSKVQLNWYDSDLHLQIDKESFLSGKPYHDGAFGYIWSGVRATHGASIGKVCYEVKITEELKWEDFIRQPDKGRRDRERRDSKRERSERRDKSLEKKKSGDKSSDKKDLKEKEKESEKVVVEEGKDSEQTDDKHEESNIEKNPGEEDKTTAENDEKVITKVGETIEKAEEVKTESKDQDVEMNVNTLDSSHEGSEQPKECMDVDEVTDHKDAENTDERKDSTTDKEQATREEKVENKEKELPLIPTHLIRIGWSSLNSGLQLGESKFSYGYESSGKFVYDKNFSDYGKSFAVGDVVGAYLEFSDESINIKYTLNGEELPVAISIPKNEVPEENFSLFPHVLSRNYAFEVNLGGKNEPFFKSPESLTEYMYIDQFEDKVMGPTRPETRSECEVIMMCGLPGSGKTHWVTEHVANNPDKRYTVIGNAQLLEKMTVNGGPLKNSMKGRWDVVLDKLSKCLTKLVEVAALRRRNYVIDQTNVFPSAQRRKMRAFEGFKRRAVIVVCGDEEQARRRALQEAQDGKDVPNIAVYEMKANMSLPKVGDLIEEVTYVELDEQQAKALVQKYNKEGRDNGFGTFTPRRDYRNDRSRWQQNRRNEYRGGYRDRNYTPGRFDRGNKHGGWQPRPNSYGRDERRDNRGSSSSRSRDWRNNNRGQRPQERGRDRNTRPNRDVYNRNRPQGSGRNQGGSWQGGNWVSSGNYSGGSQGNWQGQGQGGGNWNQGYGNQGKWNYGASQGGYGQPSYGNYQNWNYYGQYQNWSGQNPHQTGANSGSNTGGNTRWAQHPGNQSAVQK